MELTDSKLNLDHSESRSVHRVVRAMHDGECPKCHNLHPSIQMEVPSGHKCPTCGYFISHEESKAAIETFRACMEDNLVVFERWRQLRKDFKLKQIM
jgi:tRNA(Ile2) C34 agmatinyltransferase TiaS